ncbi:hypothetical protein KUV57_13705 [Epibacterium sp. DP7N7-1]|nr:hypothetical protein [Epibacterium sp. DP7N7-1]
MPTKSWNAIGHVTLKSERGELIKFASITDAAEDIRRRRIILSEHPFSSNFSDGSLAFIVGTRYVLLDECGLIIPCWRVDREIAALGPLPRWYSRYHDYDSKRDFRKTPVTGTGRRRRYGRYLRHMKTRQERRENLGLEADLREMEDISVRVKIRGRRKTLPTLWDDIPHSRRGDGWKGYRRTQYKG